jgi:hypothetical protein
MVCTIDPIDLNKFSEDELEYADEQKVRKNKMAYNLMLTR